MEEKIHVCYNKFILCQRLSKKRSKRRRYELVKSCTELKKEKDREASFSEGQERTVLLMDKNVLRSLQNQSFFEACGVKKEDFLIQMFSYITAG